MGERLPRCWIEADPPVTSIVAGQTLSFQLRCAQVTPQPRPLRWYCKNGGEHLGETVEGPSAAAVWPATRWSWLGTHRVVCTHRAMGPSGDEIQEVSLAITVVGSNAAAAPGCIRVFADPPVTSIVPEQRMRFRIERVCSDGDGGERKAQDARWLIVADGQGGPRWAGSIRYVGADDELVLSDWSIGHHRVIARVLIGGVRYDYEYPLSVVSMDTVVASAPFVSAQPDDPTVVVASLDGELRLLAQMAQAQPAPPNKRAAYETYVAERQDYLVRLRGLLEPTAGKPRIPLKALYFSAHNPYSPQTQSQWMPLNVFLCNYEGDRWMLVDWTNPTQEQTCGSYDGVWANRNNTPDEAILEWALDARYPEGVISYEYVLGPNGPVAPIEGRRAPAGVPITGGEVTRIRYRFATDGRSRLEELTRWLDWIALGGAVVAGVVTLVAPVPGSQVVSACIWAAIFSSTAAAIINIAQRHANGFGGWRDDAFDALTIAGNLFAVGAAAQIWKRGATLTLATARGVQKMIIIGQFSSDGLQGVLLAANYYADVQQIATDPQLAPHERLRKLVTLIARLGIDGTLLAINLKGTKRDLANVTRENRYLPPEKTPRQRLDELQDPRAEIDLTDLKRAEGTTDQGTHRTEVQATPDKVRVRRDPMPRQEAMDILVNAERKEMAALHGLREKELPPAVATLVDTRTGQVFHGKNLKNRFKSEDLHPCCRSAGRSTWISTRRIDRATKTVTQGITAKSRP